MLPALALMALAIAGMVACGGGGTGYNNTSGTPAGTYQVQINASSGTLTHSTTVSLTVQ